MEDELAFLDGQAQPDVTAQPPAPEPAPAPEPQPAIEPAPVATEQAPKPEPVMVPLAALHEVRDEVKTLRAKLAERETAQPVQPVELPDPLDDPQGFMKTAQDFAARQVLHTKLNITEDLAREKYGDELVNTARDWAVEKFRQDNALGERVMASANPYRTVVEMYQREQMMAQVTPDAWQQFQAWQQAQATMAQPAPQPQLSVEAPPKSIAAAPSAGGVGHVALGDQAIFDDVFKR